MNPVGLSKDEFAATPAAAALANLSPQILESWKARVREEIPAGTHLAEPILTNTVPAFLRNLAESISHEHPRRYATEGTSFSEEHGGERARLTRYGPEQLIKEYQLLRDTICEELTKAVELTRHVLDVINVSIDEAVCKATMAYFLVYSRIREQFVATLGHDLRNPLSAAKMAAELIVDSAESAEVKELARKGLTNIRRIDRMIQDLLDASVLHVGEKLPLQFGECEMRSLLQSCVADLPAQQRKCVRLEGPKVTGFWDPEGLRRCFENLITNAFKYGEPGKPVTITLAAIGGRVIVRVHNEGQPIPKDEQEGLFQPFRRSHNAQVSGKKGWGIGLGIVRGVAEGHGGSIVIDSFPGRGTTMIFDIPIDARPFKDAPTLG